MKLFGLDIRRAKASEPSIPAKFEFRPTAPQGWMTSWFQDYITRKVSGQFYEALREGIPIIDSAIRRLISLNGTIKIIGDNSTLVAELEDFCLNVPVNDTQKGIHAFLENASNETFEQGFSLSEFILTPDMKDVAGLRVADSKDIIYRRNAEGRAEPWYRYPGYAPASVYARPETIVQNILTATYNQVVYVSGAWEQKLTPDNKLYFSINNENSDPYGVSIMRSMEFVSKILMTMQNSVMNVWERFGDPSYHVKYKTTKRDLLGVDVEARRQKLASDFTSAMTSKRAGKSADFVTAVNADADITIEVIGHDNQILQLDVPSRHVLEQIVAKTNLPAWMLGLYWSTTERMATLEVESCLQDAKIRQLAMLPEFIRLFSFVLTLRGRSWKTITTDPKKPGDWGIIFETPNLRDLVAQAQARFLNAQADMMQGGAIAASTTSVNVGGATFDVQGSRLKAQGEVRTPCSCGQVHKELSRPAPWPELDKIEADYEAELKYDWSEFQEKVFIILKLSGQSNQRSIPLRLRKEDLPTIEAFTFADEQRKAIMNAMKNYIGEYDLSNADSAIRWYYGAAYSDGVIQAAKLLGKERPILDIIKNRETYDALCNTGFQLLKDNVTRAITGQIIPEMEAQVIAGANPINVAERLSKLFGDQNSDWERLARSEITQAAERAKLDEWAEWNVKKADFTPAPDACPICVALAGEYPIDKCPVPVRDTHPRCRCSTRPATSEVG